LVAKILEILKTKTKTLFFVIETPRDQDVDLEGYITVL